jgi:hypothetical protein
MVPHMCNFYVFMCEIKINKKRVPIGLFDLHANIEGSLTGENSASCNKDR